MVKLHDDPMEVATLLTAGALFVALGLFVLSPDDPWVGLFLIAGGVTVWVRIVVTESIQRRTTESDA